jgi:hypothetical protein
MRIGAFQEESIDRLRRHRIAPAAVQDLMKGLSRIRRLAKERTDRELQELLSVVEDPARYIQNEVMREFGRPLRGPVPSEAARIPKRTATVEDREADPEDIPF